MKFKILNLICLIFLSANISISNPDFPHVLDPSKHEIITQNLPENWSKNGLLIFPEMERKPWIEAIQSAKKIYMGAYRLQDPDVINALIMSAHNKVEIHVILEKNLKNMTVHLIKNLHFKN